LPGRYRLTAAVHDSRDPIAYDYLEEAYSFRVVEGGTAEKEGLLTLDATWEQMGEPETTPVTPDTSLGEIDYVVGTPF
jgi:hypothetical protein